MFHWAESFHCTMGWHRSVGIIIFPGACSICFSLFVSSCLSKKKQEFSTTHFSSLSKQLNYSDKIPLIWKCLNKWSSGLLTSLRTASLLREFPVVLITVLVPFFYFRDFWYNAAQLLVQSTQSFFWNQRRCCLSCRPSASSEFKSNLCASKDTLRIREADRNNKKIKWQTELSIH